MNPSSTSFAGSVPVNYEKHLVPLLFDPYAIDLVTRIPDKGVKRVLELACGTGILTHHLHAALSTDSKIEASDLNEDMIRIGREKVKSEKVTWSKVDMQQIGFGDQSFDLVVCQFGLMFVPDKKKAFAEIHRVLKPGGIFLFNVWDSLSQNPAFELADKVVNRHFAQNPVPFYKVPFSFHDPELIQSFLTGAGFKDIRIERVTKTGIAEVDSAVAGMIEGNPAYGYIIERDAALVPVVKEELKTELSSRFGSHPLKAVMNAWVVLAEVS